MYSIINSMSPPDTIYDNCYNDGDELVCSKSAGW